MQNSETKVRPDTPEMIRVKTLESEILSLAAVNGQVDSEQYTEVREKVRVFAQEAAISGNEDTLGLARHLVGMLQTQEENIRFDLLRHELTTLEEQVVTTDNDNISELSMLSSKIYELIQKMERMSAERNMTAVLETARNLRAGVEERLQQSLFSPSS